MVSREECVTALNNYIREEDKEKYMIQLLTYLCEIKNVSDINKTVNTLTSNPFILGAIALQIIEELCEHFKLNKVLNKFNLPIMVL